LSNPQDSGQVSQLGGSIKLGTTIDLHLSEVQAGDVTNDVYPIGSFIKDYLSN